MDQFKHLHPKFREVAALPDEQRKQFIKQKRWINYPVATRAINILAETLNYPKQARMPWLLLTGDSNNGKTSIIERFCKLHGEEYVTEEEEILIKPVVVIEQSGPSIRDLYYTILKNFWAPIGPNTVISTMRNEALSHLLQSKTQMLIIDEFHTLSNGTARAKNDALAEIKRISNTLRIPIVATGIPAAANIIREDSQIQSRFTSMQLPKWRLNKDFRSLLNAFEKVLPLREPSELASKKLATEIHAISQGNLGNIHELLKVCANSAITKGTEKIDVDIVESFSCYTPTDGPRYIEL